MEKIILIGFGGHSKSVIDTIERQNKYEIVGVLETPGKENCKYRDYHVIGTDERLEELYENGVRNAFVTLGFMGHSSVRNYMYRELKSIGFTLPSIADPSAIIADDVLIGEGTFVGKGAIINADAIVGKMCIINTRAVLEHEVRVGDFCHISVGTILCGRALVKKNTFVGAGATVIQGIHIGEASMIGAGTTIARDVDDKMLIYGKIKKQIGEF